VPTGTYTIGLRAVNAAGSSATAGPVTLTFPGACAGPPETVTNLRAYRTGRTVCAAWDPPASGPAPTADVLHASGALSGSFATTSRLMAGVVASGTYVVTVVGTNACGARTTAPTRTVVVP